MSIRSFFGLSERITLSPRVIHWINQAPTFALLDNDEQALEIAHSLDAIVEGREHIQAVVLTLRDRVAQDQARIIELEALLSQTSTHTMAIEAQRNSDRSTTPSTKEAITQAAKAAYVSTAAEPIRPNPNSARAATMKLADAGDAMMRAVKGA